MGKKLLVLHGPNLNLLGEREGLQGGRLADLDAALTARATELGLELQVVQSNHEGVLIDTLHAARSQVQGVVVSPAGLFGSHPLMEALEAVGLPALEVYLEPLGSRESVVAEACAATLAGQGFRAYLEALERFSRDDLAGDFSREDDEDEAEDDEADEEDADAEEETSDGPVKSLGRRAPAAKPKVEAAPAPGQRKTLGRKVEAPSASAAPAKTLGRKAKDDKAAASSGLTRALVRQKIADRLAGRLEPAELAAWARKHWLEVQGGGAAEEGHRALIEDSLQRLTFSTLPANRLTEPQLVDLMARLDR